MLPRNYFLHNRYRIIRPLGRGGFGQVYEALDDKLDCIVAIKERRAELDQEKMRRAFEREAKLLANLRHPVLPKVMDHFFEGNDQYLVMEFIEGDDLAKLLSKRQQPFSLEQVLLWSDELLRALEYLHTKPEGIIHRDIKPANIKLTNEGEIFLLDFGLAKGYAGEMAFPETSQQSSSVYGYTAAYAPLEQLNKSGTNEQSDIYSLGSTLYHLLTGRVPVTASQRYQSIEMGERDPLLPAHEVNPAVPLPVSLVLSRAMAMSRRDRLRSAAEMRQALIEARRVISEAETVSPSEINEQASKGKKRGEADTVDPSWASTVVESEPQDEEDSAGQFKEEMARAARAREELEALKREQEHDRQRMEEAARETEEKRLRQAEAEQQQQEGVRAGQRRLKEEVGVTSLSGASNDGGENDDGGNDDGSDAEKPLYVDDNVQFTVYRPKKIRPRKIYTLLAFAHLSERRPDAPADETDPLEEVRDQARRVLGKESADYQDVRQDARHGVPHEGELTFEPHVPGIEFDPPRRSFRWRKAVHREEFDMWALPNMDGQTLKGLMTVFLGTIVIAEVALSIRVDSGSTAEAEAVSMDEPQTAYRFRQIFVSYSHKDSEIVQEFALLAPMFGSEYLLDRTHLRPGEDWREGLKRLIGQADTFQLFWSRNSMRSQEVRNEIEYALTIRKPNFILPTYWEEPMPRSAEENLPPKEIDRLHFYRIYPGVLGRFPSTTAAAFSPDRESKAEEELRRIDEEQSTQLPVLTVRPTAEDSLMPASPQPLSPPPPQDQPRARTLRIAALSGLALLFLGLTIPTFLFYSSKNSATSSANIPLNTSPNSNVSTHQREFTLKYTLGSHMADVWTVAFAPDGKRAASAGYDQIVRVWDARAWVLADQLKGHKDTIRSIAFSPDGKLIASGSIDKTIKLWSVLSGSLTRTIGLDSNGLGAAYIAFSPDGRILSAGDYIYIKLWSVETGQEIATFNQKSLVTDVAFSPDGKTLASAGTDETIRLWSLDTKTETSRIPTMMATSLAFSPDGETLASAHGDNSITLWNWRSGQKEKVLLGHKGIVTAIAFTLDGQLMASASDDETIKIWDARSGALRQTLTGHKRGVESISFSPDGNTLISGGLDQNVKVWQSN